MTVLAEAARPDVAADVRDRVALASRVLGREGHEDFVWGHVSERDAGGRGAWMKRNGCGLTEVEPGDVLLVGRDGSVLAGEGPRHSEYPIHTEILATRADVGAVVHTHPPHAIALGAAGAPLLAVSHAATAFVPPDLPRFTQTSELITTPELGAAVAETLADRPALLLVNHGIVAVGPDIPTAVVRAVVLERACRQQLLVAGFGAAVNVTPDEAALSKRAAVWSAPAVDAVWAQLVRLLPYDIREGATG